MSIYYVQNQKIQIFNLYKKQVDIQAIFIINQLEILHNNISNEVAIYPQFDDIQSAIYDVDNIKIYSTFKQDFIPKDKKYILQDNKYYFMYDIDPYYLGAAHLVIQVPKASIYTQYYTKAILIVLLILIFLFLTSFTLAKILLKPLTNNLTQLNRFIKDTTHELNTPISTILANIEMLNIKDMNEKNIKKINRIKIGANTISTIYNDLSFLLLYNKQNSNDTNLDLSDILKDRIEYFKALSNSKNISLTVNIIDGIILYIDNQKVQRLFDNLISNAIKYSSLNSSIIISLNENYFCIEDYGVGMSEEELNQIFIRYKRFNTNVGGFGIGYSIISSIIQEYNIEIDIQSKKGVGTKVILRW
jgi:two-component system OmpR family sensor kinase